jgi:hypothetical protein
MILWLRLLTLQDHHWLVFWFSLLVLMLISCSLNSRIFWVWIGFYGFRFEVASWILFVIGVFGLDMMFSGFSFLILLFHNYVVFYFKIKKLHI